ncbi:MAG: TRAFs-binding domain-containing protein [Acidobacteriota bacterium]|nr:TRAFs-binding domain-containing protein [Acidobacteriota bacterium]
MPYDPSPIDTSREKLTDELARFAGLLARNTHDVWARQRLADGWRWGPKRDDLRKEHPDLVPYEFLAEGKKEYVLATATEALKTILAMGGIVQAPARSDSPRTPEQSRKSRRGVLLERWRSRRRLELPLNEYRELAEGMLDLEEPLLAFDIASEGLKSRPLDVRLRQLKALALARSGSPEEAESILKALVAEGHRDQETLGMQARVLKDRGLLAAAPAERERLLRSARDSYREAWRSPLEYWSGINAATLSLLLGETADAKNLASQIRATCLEKRAKTEEPDYWLEATIGEAELILENWNEADKYYSSAASIAGDDLARLASTRRNAHLILTHYQHDTKRFDRCFRIPSVAVFTGHRVDLPGRPSPRFPSGSDFEARLREAIREQVERLNIRVGYASAASGSDIVFLETVREFGGRIYIVLPSDPEIFRQESVADSGGNWTARFRDLLAQADDVTCASHQRITAGSASYDYANDLIHGLARIRAEQLNTPLLRLAVWDGQPGDGAGGTADVVARWRTGSDVHILDPAALREGRPPLSVLPAIPGSPQLANSARAMLFGDVKNFSGLTEAQMPGFIQYFMGAIARLVDRTSPKPYVNTWGDGLFLVFDNLRVAGKFAIELLALINGTKWGALGLRADLTLRVALHAGPVYEYSDPFREGSRNYIGTHVNRAARMEPVTPPGLIYVSQAFAALAHVQGIDDFQFVYAGETELPKSAGLIPLYAMRAAAVGI